jgi:hypothetical protein
MKKQYIALLAPIGMFFTGCATTPRQVPADHPVIGVWDYESNNEQWSREFTANGTCVLIGPNGKTWWVSDYYPVNESFVYVISSKGDRWPHEILSDGRLLIDKGNIATKRAEEGK